MNVNADWNASSGDAQILNKPTIPSATPPLKSQTANYTILASDGNGVIVYSGSDGATFTLPDITGGVAVGWRITVVCNSSSGDFVRVSGMAVI